MPLDQGFRSINENRHLLIVAVDQQIRKLLVGRSLPFAIIVGDEKMVNASITTNCVKLEQTLPMLVAVTNWLQKGSGKLVLKHEILVPPPGTKLS